MTDSDVALEAHQDQIFTALALALDSGPMALTVVLDS